MRQAPGSSNPLHLLGHSRNHAILEGVASLKAITCEYANVTPGGWLHANMDTNMDKSTHL